MNTKVAIASDLDGCALKTSIIEYLLATGSIVIDLGIDEKFSKLTSCLSREPMPGILLCGSDVALPFLDPNIRAAICSDATMARIAREDNDANVLVIDERLTAAKTAQACITTFLTSGQLFPEEKLNVCG